MSTRPRIHGAYRSVSALEMMEAIGASLSAIKAEDGLTDADLGAELGKSEDQAAKYRTALAEMPATVFIRACRRWNGRFANRIFGLFGGKLVMLDPGRESDRAGQTALMRAVLALQDALEDDVLDDVELVQRRGILEEAGRAIDQWRARMTQRTEA